MRNNYVTLVYLSQDEENANYLAEVLEETKHVQVHTFEKGEDSDQEIIKDLVESCGLIILHISDDFDYGDYLAEIKKANNHCQIICCYLTKAPYQTNYPLNEIELGEGYPIEALANDICQIVAGGYNKVKVHWYNKKKMRNLAFQYFDQEAYVWSLGILIKLFRNNDLEVKEKIADAYANLMDNDKAINYYSICLPMDTQSSVGVKDENSQGIIYNNLGYLYTQTKNLEFAERYLKQAIALKNPDALYNLGYLYESSWSYDSSKRRTKEGYDLYCKVLYEKYTSDSSKERAKEKLQKAADRLLARKNYAAALQYYKAIGDGTRAAECIRNIKRIRQLYEERKKRQMGGAKPAAVKPSAKTAVTPQQAAKKTIVEKKVVQQPVKKVAVEEEKPSTEE